MEDMIAVYRLNEEKLSFNMQVLTEKAQTNEKAIDRYTKTKRLAKNKWTQDKELFAADRKKFRKENDRLTKAFKKQTRLYKEVQQ